MEEIWDSRPIILKQIKQAIKEFPREYSPNHFYGTKSEVELYRKILEGKPWR